MAGYLDKLPPWCQDDLRPVMGTSCDFRIHPDPLTKREQLLLLSLWRRVLIPCLPNQCALRTWLAQKKDIPISHGPDNKASPHAYDKDVAFASIFQDLAMQAATNPPVDSDVLHPMRPQLLALRIVAYCIAIEHLEVVNSLLLGGRMPFNFLHDHWTAAVQDYLDGKPLFEVFTVEYYLDIMALLPSTQYQVILIDKNGRRLADSAVTSLKHDGGKGVELPVDMYVVHEAAPDRDLPDIIRIDCTGLGGHDLGGPDRWHICIRSDRHGQNIYWPQRKLYCTTR